MKKASKFVAMVLLLTLIASFPPSSASMAESASFADSGMPIMAAYPIWADIFGASDVGTDVQSEVTKDGEQTMLLVDNLAIYINRSTFKLEQLILAYRHAGITSFESDLRAMALFAAIEYPSIPADPVKIKEARAVAVEILQELRDVMKRRKSDIEAGEFVAFHIGRGAIYYIYQGKDMSGIIIV